uniref:Tc1-like transposase DDE domain-containing protein n=1 Tax=Phytophthora ramorum TaxID=164328 RepID=H3GKV2_PHYRM
MSVEVMSKLEEYLDEDSRHTCEQMGDKSCSDMDVSAPMNKIVVVTNNASHHGEVKTLAREMLVVDGIMNSNKLVVLRLAPYSPMLIPIEGSCNVFKAKMHRYIAEQKEGFLVRGSHKGGC